MPGELSRRDALRCAAGCGAMLLLAACGDDGSNAKAGSPEGGGNSTGSPPTAADGQPVDRAAAGRTSPAEVGEQASASPSDTSSGGTPSGGSSSGGTTSGGTSSGSAGGTPAGALIQTSSVPVGSGVVVGAYVITQPSVGSFRAFQNLCTHIGKPLTVSGSQIPCSMRTAGHGSVFSLTGAVVSGPAGVPLNAVAIVVRDGWVCRA